MGQSIDFKKRKVVVPPQKNSANRSCTFGNNEIANNISISCCKIMMHLYSVQPLPGRLA